MNSNNIKYTPFKVKDLSLADWGRKEITIAESEMPGLMSLRKEFKRFVGRPSVRHPML